MDQDQDVLDSLMTGLSAREQSGLLDAIHEAQVDQLDRKKHPPRRRRRDASGELVAAAEGEDEFSVELSS